MKDEITLGGMRLDFIRPHVMTDERTAPNQEEHARIVARHALRILMMGWPKEGIGSIVSWDLFRAIFIQRDPHLLRGMRYVFQEGFQYVYEQLKQKNLTESERAQVDLYLSNCLSVLPFSDITPYESISIPQYIHGEWELVDYQVVPIELTPTSGFDKLFLREEDRVFAYGLEPISQREAEPQLIFMGTTYPAGQGLEAQLYTDIEAFETPGKKLYLTGRERLLKWIDRQQKKPHVCGMSLGGVLALLLAVDKGDKLSRVDALNPPGLYNPWHKDTYDHWDTLYRARKAPPVYVQKQGNDPVSAFGCWRQGFQIYHVVPPQDKQGPNGFMDHALNYAGLEGTQFIPVEVDADNQARRFRDYCIFVLLRGMIHYGIMMPYHYLFRPIVYFLWDHLIALSVLVGAMLILPYLPAMVSTVVTALVALVCACYLLNILMNTIHVLWGTHEVKPLACHEASALRNESLDIYKREATATFTIQELGAYHYAKHSLFSRADTTLLGGLSKQEILDRSIHPVLAHEKITVTASQAKIYDIQRTLQQTHHFRSNTELYSVFSEQEAFQYEMA